MHVVLGGGGGTSLGRMEGWKCGAGEGGVTWRELGHHEGQNKQANKQNM